MKTVIVLLVVEAKCGVFESTWKCIIGNKFNYFKPNKNYAVEVFTMPSTRCLNDKFSFPNLKSSNFALKRTSREFALCMSSLYLKVTQRAVESFSWKAIKLYV